MLCATWLCGAGSPGTAGWYRCWLMAPRSVRGSSVVWEEQRQDLGEGGREKQVLSRHYRQLE